MVDELSSAQVISGVAYVVTQVGGRAAAALSDFEGDTTFLADHQGAACRVSGVGALSEGGVHFSEKASGTGKDVRVWHITRPSTDGPFEAEPISIF